MKEQPKPGERVKPTGTFLACTGQQAGEEGSKVWTVLECPCQSCAGGGLVAVNEEADLSWYTAEEVAALPHLKWRHIAIGNLMPASGPGCLRAEYYEIPTVARRPGKRSRAA